MMPLTGIDPEYRKQAIAWYVRMCSGEASEQERQGCRLWIESDPMHRLAWRRVAEISDALQSVPGDLAVPALRSVERGRRTALKRLAGTASLGLVAAVGFRVLPWQEWTATCRTGAGERQRVVLEDGSQLWLNSQSAADVRFDREQRLVRLLAGELVLQTAHRVGETRPLRVQTEHGRVQALGTRFLVRLRDDVTEVTVLEHAVDITPRRQPLPAVRLDAGWRVAFDANRVLAPVQADANADAWIDNQLIVDDRPLGEVVEELARHRRGWLRCDPAVAGIRVSGVYPLDDIDIALQTLMRRFPIRIRGLGRIWAVVEAA